LYYRCKSSSHAKCVIFFHEYHFLFSWALIHLRRRRRIITQCLMIFGWRLAPFGLACPFLVRDTIFTLTEGKGALSFLTSFTRFIIYANG
jgi:hypothetical protein